MKKILIFISLIALLIISFFLWQTNTEENLNDVSLQGQWQPQYTNFSCWKATARNLNLYQETLDTNFTPSDIAKLDDESFQEKVLSKNYSFKTTKNEGQVLTFNSLKKVLNVPKPRPLIYGYYIEREYDMSGHFVNLIGTKESKTNKGMHSQWIEVYDPWPVNKGNKYLRNYNSYAYRNEKRGPRLDKTYFGFQMKKETFSNQFKDIKTTDRKGFSFVSKNKFIPENNFDQISEIIKDTLFEKYIGKYKSFHANWIPVKEYFKAEKNEKRTMQLSTIEKQPKSRILITYDENNQVHGAITVENIKGKQYIIDRIDDFSEYKLLNKILKSNPDELSLILNDKEDIFLEFKENNIRKYYDFNGRIYKKDAIIPNDSLQKFYEVLKNDKLKITEGINRYIDAINDLLQNRNCNCYTQAGQYNCEDFKDDTLKPKAYLNKFEINKQNFIKVLLKNNNSEQNVTVIAKYIKHDSLNKFFSFRTFKSPASDPNDNRIFKDLYGEAYSFKHPLLNNSLQIDLYFIPISKYLENDSTNIKKALVPWKIQYVSKPYLSSNIIDSSENSTSGIIFEVLVNGVIIPCYVLASNNFFIWKK
jgi:hypothetical protein